MGRELRRKQAKKEGKSLDKNVEVEKNQLKSLFKITVLLLVIISVIYLISALFITKELDWFNKDKDNSLENDGVSNSILASTIFNQTEEEYYVYFYDFKDEKVELSNLITSKLSSQKIYRVDTSTALNSKYVSENGNKDAKTLEELKVKAPTLIKISGDTISEYYENEEIANSFN